MTDTLVENEILEEMIAAPSGYQFSLNDRCDQDKGSKRTDGKGFGVAEQAFYRASKDDLELFLCIHHYNRNATALVTGGWKIEESPAVAGYGVKNYIYSEQ